ncbi:MAG: ChaN family lipoprotein [Bdellovibrionales bacterium]|nr:ChaN family lipoprotein [Bdellovibrionales bacterium]
MQGKQVWIKSRKNLLAQVKNQVLAIQGEDSSVDAYAKSYKKEFLGRWQKYGKQQFIAELVKYSVVLGGDFHAFSQSQRSHLRILREWPEQKSLILALECFEAKHQKFIDQYMNGDIQEDIFLEHCQWYEHWGFSWQQYKPLLEFAKERKIKVVGINKYYKKRYIQSLHKRDVYAAQQIVKLIKKYPSATIYTIYGDLHLASNHLPQQIKELNESKKIKVGIVFQNSEKLYFKLAQKNEESDVEILKGTKSRYCIMSSPPWVKWQSYLMFLEGSYDDDIEEDYENIDFTDHVAHLAQIIESDIGLKIKMDDLAVYTSEDFEVWRSIADKLNVKHRKLFQSSLTEERTFILPEYAFYYLSRISINHCAHLAGFYIHKKVSNLSRCLWDMPNDFLPLIWHESMAFFLSKFINHKRKAEKLKVIESKLRLISPKDRGREALALVLDQRTDEWIYIKSGRHKKNPIHIKHMISYLQAARILGSVLGEKLYKSYTFGRISKKSLLKCLTKNLTDKDFKEFYYFMVKKIEAQSALDPERVQL